MIDLAWISAGGSGAGDRAELHDRGQSGVPLAGAGLGDRNLSRAVLGTTTSRSARSWRGFPTDLFLTLVGVTLLFTLARGNGTLDQVVRAALRGCRGNAGLIPIVFFGLSWASRRSGRATSRPPRLIAPLAMAVADRAEIPPFLMTLMVAHGCIAGALSPIAPTGIIANGLMARMGMSGFERQNYLSNLAGQCRWPPAWVISPSAAGGCSARR